MALTQAGMQPKPGPEEAVVIAVGEGNFINKSKELAGLVHRQQSALRSWYGFTIKALSLTLNAPDLV